MAPTLASVCLVIPGSKQGHAIDTGVGGRVSEQQTACEGVAGGRDQAEHKLDYQWQGVSGEIYTYTVSHIYTLSHTYTYIHTVTYIHIHIHVHTHCQAVKYTSQLSVVDKTLSYFPITNLTLITMFLRLTSNF